MLIRTLLSISIASAALMASGCKTGGDNDVDLTSVNAGSPGSQPSTVTPIFSPANAKLPINTDFVFSAAATSDGTASVTDSSPPVTTAINDLAGFSTTATFYLPFNGALDADTVVAGQTVFLIELKSKEDNASIDALDLSSIIAASPTNPFAVGADQITAADYTARYVELDDGATPTIAITPLKPLDPKTKYLVALTNGIKSASGKAVSGSAEYELLSGDLGLPSAALAPARTAVQGWEKLAGGFLALATSGAITQDNIVLSYAFTTDGSLDSLKSYAAPSLFLADNLALASAEALIENANPGATTLIAQGVVQGGGGNPADAEQVAAAKLSAAYASAIYSTIASTALSQAGSLNAIADRPAARPVNIINGAVVDQTVNGALNVTTGASPATFIPGSTDSFSRYYQGQIQLPNFLATAAATMAADADWTANTTLGAVLDGAAGNAAGTTPPKDTDGSTNVTYR
ncbi:MAG: hypothetical protein P1U57_13185, partial [Oleibacter sp.]|nr:hypothetical protein [Thalassolituus sp.]